MDAFRRLLALADTLRFEPHNIRPFLDQTGRYEVELEREFPLLIKLFNFRARRYTPGATWHERLELFLPLDGDCRFRMGDRAFTLRPGDLLVVDTLQVHNVVDDPGLNTRVIVASFLPDLVFSLGSPSHDYAFLVPFYVKLKGQTRVLRRADEQASSCYGALGQLLDCYFHRRERPYFQAGCKAHLLELLYHLAGRFHASEVAQSEFNRQRSRAERFTRLLEHVSRNYAEKISVQEAAALASLSAPRFMKLFKEAAGTTFVDYLTHVRLSKAHQLLRETTESVAAVACAVGFADQSYFDRRFKAYFGQSPRDFRKALLAGSGERK